MDHVAKTLEDVKQDVAELESQLAEKKRMANLLAEMAGQDAIYDIVEKRSETQKWPTRGDEFVAARATTAFRRAFEMADAPLDVAQLYDMLLDGGYVFEAKSEANAKNSVRVTLSKNSSVFHRLSNGKYGLVKWYGAVKQAKKKAATSDEKVVDEEETLAAEQSKEFGSESLDAPAPLHE